MGIVGDAARPEAGKQPERHAAQDWELDQAEYAIPSPGDLLSQDTPVPLGTIHSMVSFPPVPLTTH
jgi:hypothetical protein